MQWTTAKEVTEIWTGSEPPEESDKVLNALILTAEAIILSRFPSIQYRITNGTLALKIVQYVVSGMVQRAFQTANDGRISYSNTTGPFAESGSYSNSRRGLYISDDELALLAPKSVQNKAFSIDMDRNSRGVAFTDSGYYNGYYYNSNGYTGRG
jgi:hypothetical protein